MKYLFFLMLVSNSVFSKEIYKYSCEIDKELKVEISLLDQNTPSVDLFYNKSKFGNCLFANTPDSSKADKKAQIAVSMWQLKLKTCNYYFEKHKDKIKLSSVATLKQPMDNTVAWLTVVEDHAPLPCRPIK